MKTESQSLSCGRASLAACRLFVCFPSCHVSTCVETELEGDGGCSLEHDMSVSEVVVKRSKWKDLLRVVILWRHIFLCPLKEIIQREGSRICFMPSFLLSAAASSLRPHAVSHVSSTCVMFYCIAIVRSLPVHATSAHELIDGCVNTYLTFILSNCSVYQWENRAQFQWTPVSVTSPTLLLFTFHNWSMYH